MVLHVRESLNMSNGFGEGGSQSRESDCKTSLFQGNDFAYAVARLAVAQICESVEANVYQAREGVRFASFQNSSLDTLTCVAVQYIQSIGKTAHFYANVAGRVEGNSFDIVQALEHLGFAGVSDTDCCLADSGVVKDIIRFTGEVDEMPFVYALPRFQINKELRSASSFSEVGAEPPHEHIPVWLPAFPEAKLCNLSEEINVGTVEGEAGASKENGPSLPCIQHSFNGGKTEVLKSPKGVRNSTEGNPFLTVSLRFVESAVLLPVFRPLELSYKVPDKHMMSNNHHIPVLEASAPSDDINEKNKLSESQDGEKKGGARAQQPLLRFEIVNLKRSSCLAIKRSVQGQGWSQEGEVKREKKSEIEENRQQIDLVSENHSLNI